jgi:hypothetical protein
MKFLFNLTTQTLKMVQDNHFLIIPKERKFFYLGGLGFYLDLSELPQSWIIFSVQREKIKAIYKTPRGDSFFYYQRELFRPPGGVVEVEFSE